MQPPKVQDLAAIMAELETAYAPQRQLFQQQQALLPGQQSAAIGGLDVAKQNSFRDINTSANARGLAFGGVPISEQMRYVGEKYLPARASVEGDFQKQGFALSQALASLHGDQTLKALDTRSGQQKVLDAYLENERERALKVQMQREQIAASRSGSGREAADRVSAASNEMFSLLDDARGGDGKVSPEAYKLGKARWAAQGFDPADFDSKFRIYVNDSHAWDYGFGSKPNQQQRPKPNLARY